MALVFAYIGYSWGRDWWRHRAEQQFNTRATSLIQGDPRFQRVYVAGQSSAITGVIMPGGTVDNAADLESLRALLQTANPPMPLDFQLVVVANPTTTTRAVDR